METEDVEAFLASLDHPLKPEILALREVILGSDPDPESLIEWLGEDRATAKFRDLAEIRARQSAFVNVIRQWIQHV